MYVDGVCPNLEWYFPYKSAPSLLAVHAVVQQQLESSKDPFSRLRCNKPTSAGASTNACRPISQCLYTAALVPKSGLHALEIRERRARGLPEAPFAQRLLKARALLEAVAEQRKSEGDAAPSNVQNNLQSSAQLKGAKNNDAEVPQVTAGTERLSSRWERFLKVSCNILIRGGLSKALITVGRPCFYALILIAPLESGGFFFRHCTCVGTNKCHTRSWYLLLEETVLGVFPQTPCCKLKNSWSSKAPGAAFPQPFGMPQVLHC